MNIRQLQVFATVAKHMSFSLAAEELLMSQPAVSQQVKGLEQHLNVKLFEWTGRRLYLTEAGEALQTHARSLLAASAELDHALAELRGSTAGRLALGANTTGGMYCLPPIARAFREQHPDAELTLQIESTSRICDRVIQRLIDVAIVTGPVRNERLAVRDLWQDELYLIASPTHPFAGRASVTHDEVAAERFVLYAAGSRTRRIIEQAFNARDARLNVAMQLGTTEAVKKAVEADLGVSLVSKYAVQRELALGELVRVPIADMRLERPIQTLSRRGKHVSPLAARFVAFAAERAATEPPALTALRGGS